MNDSMSLGIHRLWKDDFVSSMLPRLPPSVHRNPVRNGAAVPDGEAPAPEPFKCLDVAGGTGDIALRLLDRARDKFGSRDIEVEVVDLTEGMLHEGRKRVAQTMYYNSGSAFADEVLTISAADHFHARKRAGAPRARQGQLDRPVHDCLRHPQLHRHPPRPQGGVPRP